MSVQRVTRELDYLVTVYQPEESLEEAFHLCIPGEVFLAVLGVAVVLLLHILLLCARRISRRPKRKQITLPSGAVISFIDGSHQ